MEPLLLVGYGAIFVGIVVYVLYLRSRLGRLEDRIRTLEGDGED